MISKNYEILPYKPEYFLQVVDVLKYLLGNDNNKNKNYFNWKYIDNPNVEYTPGIMVLYKGKVVGFRGYCPVRFQIKNQNDNIKSLIPGDTCVHPVHRRKGLSVIMGNKAAEEYAGKYSFFLNTTATRNSLPGYLKMGYHPLVPKAYLTNCGIIGLAKYLLYTKMKYKRIVEKISYGEFGNIIVSQQPRPEEMQALLEKEKIRVNKVMLHQDQKFLRWRLSNKRNQYVFLYCIENKSLAGYLVIRISSNKLRGFIADYAGKDEASIEKLLKFIIKMKYFDVLSIYRFCLINNLEQKIEKLGFKSTSLFRVIERKTNGELPLMIRPVKQNFNDNDFFIDGLDLRKGENWYLKGMSYEDI